LRSQYPRLRSYNSWNGFCLGVLMSLAVIAGLCACFAVSSGRPVLAMMRASAIVLEQEQPGDAGQSPAQAQPEQEPAKPASETKPEPKANPPEQPKAQPGAESQPGLEPPVAPPALPKPKQAPASSKKPGSKSASKAAAKKSSTRKHATGKPAASGTPKVVVPDGGATDPDVEFSPTVSKQQADAALQNTNRLLDATDANLKRLSTRQLSDAQQDMVKQIRAYMQQAKTAAGDGDVQQATNLATKARMLSDELLKQ
jgi:predicted lipid-binding transport protein (Tim44 family)